MTTRRINNDKNMTEEQEKHNNNQGYAPYDYYNNNIHTDPGVFPREAMEHIAEAYKANIAREITQAAAHLIEDALKHGMEPETIILAIEETGLASRPSPYYLRAVLHNWAESGVTVSRVRDRQGRTSARPWWK